MVRSTKATGEDVVKLVDATAALGRILEPFELGNVGATDLVENFGPVALRIGEYAYPTVLGLVGPARDGE